METPRKKAIGYIRVSTPGQAAEGESLSTQRRQIRSYCKFKSFDLLQVVEDAGLSGARQDRPGFLKLMEMAREGAFEALVITRFSRLARNMRHLLAVHDELKELGVQLHSIAENFAGGEDPGLGRAGAVRQRPGSC